MRCTVDVRKDKQLFLGSLHEWRYLTGDVTVRELIAFLEGVKNKDDLVRVDTGDGYAHHQCVQVHESMDCDGETYIVLNTELQD